MPYINRATILGHLGRDPEVRVTSNGKRIANFTVATSEGKGDDKRTEWHTVIAVGYSVDVAETLRKGDLVWLEGPIRTRRWGGEDGGSKKQTTEIVALTLVKAEHRSKAEGSGNHPTGDIPF